MPRKPWRIMRRKQRLSDSMYHFLTTGDYCTRERFPQARDRVQIFRFAHSGAHEELRLVWLSLRDEIMAMWLRDHPATRPWAWWSFDARCEPVPGAPEFSAAQRRRLSGGGMPRHEIIAVAPRFDFGIPAHWFDADGAEFFGGVAVDEADPPTFESEAAYLDRHGLLTAAEQKHLAAQPELLDPEAVTFDE